jgi:hypothetical protein
LHFTPAEIDSSIATDSSGVKMPKIALRVSSFFAIPLFYKKQPHRFKKSTIFLF